MILLMQERGLSLTQIGLVSAAQGLVVLALELPTGGLADALGRRPVLVTAWAAQPALPRLLAVADSFALFFAGLGPAGGLPGARQRPAGVLVRRATLAADPDTTTSRGLGFAGTVAGVAIAGGALLSGGLIALGPVGPVSALTVPVLVAAALQVVALVALAVAAGRGPARPGPAALRASVAAAPRMVGQAFGLLRRSRVLLALVSVELFWGFGMVTFESLLPVRLAEVVGDPERAAALLGPANSAAWLASAAGAAATPLLLRWLGAAPRRRAAADPAGRHGGRHGPARRAGRGAGRLPRLLRRARRVQPAAPGAAAPPGRRPLPDQRHLAELDDGPARVRPRRGAAHRAGRPPPASAPRCWSARSCWPWPPRSTCRPGGPAAGPTGRRRPGRGSRARRAFGQSLKPNTSPARGNVASRPPRPEERYAYRSARAGRDPSDGRSHRC